MTQDNSNNFRPLPVVLMVVILAAIAVGGWWVKSRPIVPATASVPLVTTPLPTQQAQQQTEVTLYIPNDNAMLGKQKDSVTVVRNASFADLAKKAFATLQEKAPKNYPPGTELLNVKTGKDGTAILDFNSKFNEDSFWKGSARTLMAIYSIVNTITALPADDFKARQVQFLVKGKPIAVLGDFDVNDPLKPEMQWVQKN